jgi:EAL domain-containing protein (putative c-di-GMP-specific phosphodiesterase class I)
MCHVSTSLGIAFAEDLVEVDLLRAADMAMYSAKQCGGNRGLVFERPLYDRAARQFELERDLREAIERNDRLLLVYQPIFSVSPHRKVVGFEARLRWQHPRDGWLAPNLFVPLAEKSGLMLPLGDWILTEALRQGRRFQRFCPERDLKLSVNISPLQLVRQSYCAELADTLDREHFPPGSLCIELTESALADAAAAHVVAGIRKLGVQVALDDFGMGYSSLAHLRDLPVDIVKLDHRFLEPGAADSQVSSFIGTVINLAHAAGLSVTAKGVETPAQLTTVVTAGVDNVQGFLLARPLLADAATALL